MDMEWYLALDQNPPHTYTQLPFLIRCPSNASLTHYLAGFLFLLLSVIFYNAFSWTSLKFPIFLTIILAVGELNNDIYSKWQISAIFCVFIFSRYSYLCPTLPAMQGLHCLVNDPILWNLTLEIMLPTNLLCKYIQWNEFVEAITKGLQNKGTVTGASCDTWGASMLWTRCERPGWSFFYWHQHHIGWLAISTSQSTLHVVLLKYVNSADLWDCSYFTMMRIPIGKQKQTKTTIFSNVTFDLKRYQKVRHTCPMVKVTWKSKIFLNSLSPK